MPIAPTLITTAEIITDGRSAAGGSSVTPSRNVYYYKRTTNVNPLDKADLYTAFRLAVVVPLLAAMNVRYTSNVSTVRWLDDALDPPFIIADAGVGAIATDSLPTEDAVYFQLNTLLRGKSYRGAKHYTPLSEIDTTQDILTGAGLARWQAMKTALALPVVDAQGNTWLPVVFSRKLSQVKKNPTTVVANPVSVVFLDTTPGNMKRRRAQRVRG